MKFLTKLTAITLATLTAGLLPLASIAPKAEARVNRVDRSNITRNIVRNNDYTRNYRNIGNDRFIFNNHYYNRNHDYMFRRGHYQHNFPIRIMPNRDYFLRYGVFNRFPMFLGSFPNLLFPREFVIVDRDDMSNFIDIQNTLTGPYSVNRAILTVNHDFFTRFANDFDINQNVTISVDTGNNIVSMNTLTGNISTGDVDINIQ